MTDVDAATARAVAEFARRVRLVAPPGLLADPDAWAAAAVRWLREVEHWRPVPPSPPIVEQLGRGDPPNEAWARARAELTERTDP